MIYVAIGFMIGAIPAKVAVGDWLNRRKLRKLR